jgi:hypothetical protein
VGVANSSSKSGAVAIGGGNANAAGGKANSALTINNPANTSSSQSVSGTQTLRTTPNAYAPGLAAAGLETCLGSVSGGGSWIGTGFSFGTTIPDPGCAARLDARTLWSMGLKKAAVARLCQGTDIYNSMPEVCYEYMPHQRAGYAPLVLSTEPSQGIELIDGSTGRTRTCDNYDQVKYKCRQWHDELPHKRRMAAMVPHKMVTKPAPAKEAIELAIKKDNPGDAAAPGPQ